MSRRVPVLLVLLSAAGCVTAPPERGPAVETGTVSAPAQDRLGPAGEALLIQGANERRSGNYHAASATLERALRIEPSAPAVWLELARVRLLEGDFGQAEQLARKGGALAPTESRLASESQRIIEEARRRQAGL